MLTYILIGFAAFGLIESLRRTYEMYQDCHDFKYIVLITVINFSTFGMIGYIIKKGFDYFN